jgi:hypothetical protein
LQLTQTSQIEPEVGASQPPGLSPSVTVTSRFMAV